jgi:hypothetical protein
MRAAIALLLIWVFAWTTSGRCSASPQAAPEVKPVAVASIHVDKHRFKSGEDIELTILLEAGPGGVYIPKGWGQSGGGLPGFSVSLATLSGEGAETCGVLGDVLSTHEPDATVVLHRDYTYLPSQLIVGLKIRIVCPTKRRGKYLINAFYSPHNIDEERVAQLPETHGLVLRERVQAKPVAITIY